MTYLIMGLLILCALAFAYLYYIAWIDARDLKRYLDSIDPKKK